MLADQIGNDLFGEQVEYLRITEEAGDVDEQVLGKKIEFAAVAPQYVQVLSHVVGFDRRHRHAPLDPALQRTRLVKPEIIGGLGPKKIDNIQQNILHHVPRNR